MFTRKRGQAPCLEVSCVCVPLDREQDPPSPHVLVAVERHGRVPAMTAQLAVGGGEELLALALVLADEQHVGERGQVRVGRVADPPAQKGVVAAQLVVVLVDPARAVVRWAPARGRWNAATSPGSKRSDRDGPPRRRLIRYCAAGARSYARARRSFGWGDTFGNDGRAQPVGVAAGRRQRHARALADKGRRHRCPGQALDVELALPVRSAPRDRRAGPRGRAPWLAPTPARPAATFDNRRSTDRPASAAALAAVRRQLRL